MYNNNNNSNNNNAHHVYWHILDRATNMLNKDTDWEAVVQFCHKVNRDLEGPQTAIRLLVHKIHSPQERESLLALTVGCIFMLYLIDIVFVTYC